MNIYKRLNEDFCLSCKEATNFFNVRDPERKELHLCAECYEVKLRQEGKPGKLLECMSCDAEAVLSADNLDCKPCRVNYRPPPRTNVDGA